MHVGVGLPEKEAKAEAALQLEAGVQGAVRREATAVQERRVHAAARPRVAEARDMAATPERIMVGNRNQRVQT